MLNIPTFEEAQKLLEIARQAEITRWKHDVLLSWQWWLKLSLLLLPWAIWMKVVDKSRLREVLLYAFFVFFIALLFDEIGTEQMWWAYKFRVVPYLHILIPYDFSVLPVIYSLVYQFCRSWKTFLLVQTLLAALYAFVCENLLQQLGLYLPYTWKHSYSFPIYLVIAIFVRLLVDSILRIESRAKAQR